MLLLLNVNCYVDNDEIKWVGILKIVNCGGLCEGNSNFVKCEYVESKNADIAVTSIQRWQEQNVQHNFEKLFSADFTINKIIIRCLGRSLSSHSAILTNKFEV